MVMGGDKGAGNQSVGVADIVKLLEETEAENADLRKAINDNNQLLANKLSDMESEYCMSHDSTCHCNMTKLSL